MTRYDAGELEALPYAARGIADAQATAYKFDHAGELNPTGGIPPVLSLREDCIA